jgi:hypothetical protein
VQTEHVAGGGGQPVCVPAVPMEQKMLGYALNGVDMRVRNVTVSFLAAMTMLMA